MIKFLDWTPPAEIEKSEVNAKRFEYNQLRVATCNFSPKMKLGTGAFGAVYKVSTSKWFSKYWVIIKVSITFLVFCTCRCGGLWLWLFTESISSGISCAQGILPNHTVVAVKQLFLKTKEACDDFVNEVLLITNLQHRNLVCLKGYSLRGKEMLLVYEYVENGDLEKLLFSKSFITLTEWFRLLLNKTSLPCLDLSSP